MMGERVNKGKAERNTRMTQGSTTQMKQDEEYFQGSSVFSLCLNQDSILSASASLSFCYGPIEVWRLEENLLLAGRNEKNDSH